MDVRIDRALAVPSPFDASTCLPLPRLLFPTFSRHSFVRSIVDKQRRHRKLYSDHQICGSGGGNDKKMINNGEPCSDHGIQDLVSGCSFVFHHCLSGECNDSGGGENDSKKTKHRLEEPTTCSTNTAKQPEISGYVV